MDSKTTGGNPSTRGERLSLSSAGKGCLLSSEPKSNALAIGQSLNDLFIELSSGKEGSPEFRLVAEQLKRHNQAHLQYVDQGLLETVSCPHAVKKWAFERMPSLRIPYDMKNRLKPTQIEENADEKATIKLLDLAEDFLQIAHFCRKLEEMQIEMSPHAGGMEFIFEYMGSCDRIELRTVEDKGLNLLFKKYSRENSMRLRANASDEFVEMQIVVFKKKLRLGLSPVD